MSDGLDQDVYVISRPIKFDLMMAYGCYDKDGNKLFDVKKKLLGDQYSLLDGSGKEIGMIHKTMIAITPTYDLYDGNKNIIGKVVEEANINLVTGGKSFLLNDKDGKKLAHVTLTRPLAMAEEVLQGQAPQSATMGFEIKNSDDSVIFAKISIQKQAKTSFVARAGYANFVLEVNDKSISTLLLLEFSIAIDHLYSTSIRGPSMGLGKGGLSNIPGGFGGGGVNIGGSGIKLGL